MGRATAILALVFGLISVPEVSLAAPSGSAKPPDNPFEDKAGDSSKAEATPRSDEETDESTGESDDESAAEESRADGEGAEEGEEEESGLRGLACLEGDATGGRRKGVQRRDFLKRYRFEVAGLGGYYASDVLSSTYSYGGALAFFPSEDFGVELLVTRTPVKFRLEEPFSTFDNQDRFRSGVAWQGIVSLLWSPIHAKFKFTDATIIHGDLFAIAGAGRTFHETVLGLTWEAGLGLKLYLSRFVTFRLDVRDFLLPQEVLGRGRMSNNITVLAGLSVWIL